MIDQWGIDCDIAKYQEIEQDRNRLREKMKNFPRVWSAARCGRELESHSDFKAISRTGIELAARYVAEVLNRPDAILLEAYWDGTDDASMWVRYAYRTRTLVEGLFPGLPAYDYGPVLEDSFTMADLDLEPPDKPDGILLDLGYPLAEAHEVERSLVADGWTVQQAIRHCISAKLQQLTGEDDE